MNSQFNMHRRNSEQLVKYNKITKTGWKRPLHWNQIVSYVFYAINISLFYSCVVPSLKDELMVNLSYTLIPTHIDLINSHHNICRLMYKFFSTKSNYYKSEWSNCITRSKFTNKWSKFYAWSWTQFLLYLWSPLLPRE